MRARVIVLAGPSGAGKSRLASRLGLPVLPLDDFYREVGDPALPRIDHGPNHGMVDWDHPDSWHCDAALEAITALCRDGEADVPIYSIPDSAATGSRRLTLDGSPFFVTEGIFAAEVVPLCRERGLLAAAYCIRQHPLVTFWRRLVRDLRERRKAPMVLVGRGLTLLRAQRRVVQHAVSRGCVPATPEEAYRDITALMTSVPDAR